jgi:hypothetical protein
MTSPFRVDAHKNLPSYWEAHCAAFLGETAPAARTARDQFAIDRGTEDGLAARKQRGKIIRLKNGATWRLINSGAEPFRSVG